MSVYSFLWLDTETTGLDALNNDVVQLACIPIIKGTRAHSGFNQYCQPINWQTVDKAALEINHLSIEKLKGFQSAKAMVDSLISYLRSFKTKFTISGYNADFDRDFVSALFKKVGREREFAELFTSDVRDVLKRARLLKSQLGTPNSKLGTLAKHFNIEINAHDALSDIEATIKVDEYLAKMLGDVEPTDYQESLDITDTNVLEPVQLHCHSKYSYTDSINSVEDFAEWCKTAGAPGFSIVDHGTATSLYEILKVKNIYGVTGIPGTSLMLKHADITFWINAWAISEQGYRNLLKMSSVGWLSKVEDSTVHFPCLTLDQLELYKNGVVFGIPGANGPITKLILMGKTNQAEELISSIASKLDVRLELAAINVYKYFDSDIGFRGYPIDGGNVQKFINKLYYNISSKLSIKTVPVSDCHYIDKTDKIIQDCVSKNSFKDKRFFLEDRSILSGKEMFSILKDHVPEMTVEYFNDSVNNTIEIANKSSNIEVTHKYHLPKIDIPDDIKDASDDYDNQTYLLTMKKIKEHGRWINRPEYIDRFKKELEVIMKNTAINFLPYFLVYEDICAFARSKGLLQNIARGSAGGSLLSYYLKIIHIDPIASNLPFERFLSKARIRAGSFPDIDLDLADRARPLVMKYLVDKYGLGFAQISTFNKMKTKNAIKDAMMALYGRNRNDPEVKTVCESIPDSPQGVDEFDFLYGYVDQEGLEHRGLVQDNELVASFFNNRPEIEQMVKKLIGSIRGYSRHASAFVISTLDLSSDRVPTMQMDDKELGTITVTQYDAPMIEKNGLVKADILGIKTLTMTSDCIDLIKKNHGIDMLEEVNGVPLIYRLPEDKGVYEDFYKRDTDSSFQFNTELIKGYAREFCPLKRADLATMTALCRPGALDAPLYDTTAAQYYIDVRNGKRTVEYLHSDLEPILKDSNGIFCISEGSLISTKDGLIPIEDVKIGSEVLTENGSYQKVLANWYRGKKATLIIRGSNGMELTCTPDHKILTQDGWKEAQNLNRNDLIKSFWMADNLDLGDKKDWLVGLALADGNLTADTINIACSSKEFAEKVCDIAREAFNLGAPYAKRSGRCWYAVMAHTRSNNGFFNKNYEPNPFKQYLKNLNLLGLDCYSKFLPRPSLYMLAGFIEGDGCLSNNRIRLCNERLAKDLFLALQAGSIHSSYFKDKDGVHTVTFDPFKLPLIIKKKILKKNRTACVPRSYLPKLSKNNYYYQHSTKKWKNIPISKYVIDDLNIKCDHDIWSRVISIEKGPDSNVYDLSVNNVHSFVANGLVVHNCYQEEVMTFLVKIVGYTWEESDMIRSAIAKKKHEVIMATFAKIRSACSARGWNEEAIETVCQQIMAFSRYSFNKSHSYAYGELGYITLFLKRNYPLEWWCSVLNNEDNEDKIRKFIGKLSDKITPPSMKEPKQQYVIANGKIVSPVSSIKGIGPSVVQELTVKGPFLSIEDFMSRIDHTKVNIGHVSAFIRARAADDLMDKNLPTYSEQRSAFMRRYKNLRKSKVEFKEELKDTRPISLFLQERESNQSFNKTLLEDRDIMLELKTKWPALQITGRKALPLLMKDVPILLNVRLAEAYTEKEYSETVGMILLFDSSSFSQGVSKKGRPWSKLSVMLSDGNRVIEAVNWNANKALGWTKDSLVYVRGNLKKGWKTPASIDIIEINRGGNDL